MSRIEKLFSSKLFTIFIAFTILFTATGLTTLPQEGCPACGCGDIPLDEETYQRYLKPVDPEDRLDTVLPSAYNAKTLGYVTSAKNQAACGGCWAFASVGAFESHLIIAGYATNTIDLSEQQQVSCNRDQYGCCGGSSDAPLFWETRGPVYEACYPYGDAAGWPDCAEEPYSNVACTTTCPQLPYRVTNFYTVPASTTDFKTSLYEDGPSYFRFTVFSDFYTFWSGASIGTVYKNTGGSVLGGHAVLLIGWDDAKQAFLLKNSWGSTSGPQGDGTFWMAYSGHTNSLNFQMSNFDVVPTNQAPIANAGLDQEVTPGSIVTLNGSSSYDPDGNTPLTYQWAQTAGTAVSLSSSTAANPTFTAPATPGLLTFRLVVTDSLALASAPDFVNIFNGIEPFFELYLPLIMKGGFTDPIINGGFELGHVAWSEYSTHGWEIIMTDASAPGEVYPHAGDWLAWLGGDYNDTSYVSQSITIPSSSPYLHYWYWIGSQDICGYDYFRVKLGSTTVQTKNLCNTTNTSGWVQGVVNLSSYVGSTAGLKFEVTTDGSANSNLFLDDVSFSNVSTVSPEVNIPNGTDLEQLSQPRQ